MCPRTIKPTKLTEYDSDELTSKINLFMYEIKMPPNIKGHKYLLSAIKTVYLEPSSINNVLNGLYLKIAREYNTSVSCVEKDIRTAIGIVWKYEDTKKLDSYLERSLHSRETKPSPKEFIALVADKLRRNLIYS